MSHIFYQFLLALSIEMEHWHGIGEYTTFLRKRLAELHVFDKLYWFLFAVGIEVEQPEVNTTF